MQAQLDGPPHRIAQRQAGRSSPAEAPLKAGGGGATADNLPAGLDDQALQQGSKSGPVIGAESDRSSSSTSSSSYSGIGRNSSESIDDAAAAGAEDSLKPSGSQPSSNGGSSDPSDSAALESSSASSNGGLEIGSTGGSPAQQGSTSNEAPSSQGKPGKSSSAGSGINGSSANGASARNIGAGSKASTADTLVLHSEQAFRAAEEAPAAGSGSENAPSNGGSSADPSKPITQSGQTKGARPSSNDSEQPHPAATGAAAAASSVAEASALARPSGGDAAASYSSGGTSSSEHSAAHGTQHTLKSSEHSTASTPGTPKSSEQSTASNPATPGSKHSTASNPFTPKGSEHSTASTPATPEGCPRLSRELLQQHAKRSTVMLGVMNRFQQDFGLNWLRHVQSLGLRYYLVGAADANTSALLVRMQVPCFDFTEEGGGNLPAEEFTRGKEGWRRMTWLKVFLLDRVVDWGFNLVMSDMDAIWLRDPLPLFDSHPHAEVIFSHDHEGTFNAAGDDGLEYWANMNWSFNTGAYLLRSTPNATRWAHAWRAMFPTSKDHDQHAAYDLTRHGATSQHPADPRVRAAFNESLFIGIMPSYLFASGHTFMVQRLHEAKAVQPLGVHLTWTYYGNGGKRARARDAGLWFDSEDYYSSPSFVTLDLDIPPLPEGYAGWNDTEAMIMHHLSTIHHQLQQAYVGMGLAVASGRAFISPKFECRCDRVWYALDKCRMGMAHDMRLPFTCVTDYLFQPDNFQDSPARFGTPLDFREPSFLDNPRTPQEVKEYLLEIRPSASLGCTNCTREQQGAGGGPPILLVPTGLRDRQLLPLLEPYRRYRVWRLGFAGLRSLTQAFAGFSCSGAAREFDKRMAHIPAEWCCRGEEAAKQYNRTVLENLQMSPQAELFSAQPGLDPTC